VYSTLPNYCSEDEKDMEYFDEEFYVSDYPGQLPVDLQYLSAAMSSRVFNLLFCKTLFGNKYIIL
jgi:hypothetical protein